MQKNREAALEINSILLVLTLGSLPSSTLWSRLCNSIPIIDFMKVYFTRNYFLHKLILEQTVSRDTTYNHSLLL